MELTDYDKKTFKLIEEKLKIDKWYSIDVNRPDYIELVSSLDKFHECYGLIEWFDDNKTKYKIVLRENVVDKYVKSLNRDTNKTVGSTKTKKTYIHTEITSNVVKKDVNRNPNWSIPCFRSRPDIGEKIMKEYNENRIAKLDQQKEDIQKLNKIKKWKEN